MPFLCFRPFQRGKLRPEEATMSAGTGTALTSALECKETAQALRDGGEAQQGAGRAWRAVPAPHRGAPSPRKPLWGRNLGSGTL